MVACLEGLSLANSTSNIRSTAALVLEAGEGDKDGEFYSKIEFLHFRHSYAREAAHWAYLFTVTDSPCFELACLKRAHPSLLLLGGWSVSNKMTRNDEVHILAGDPNERGD